MQYPYAIIGRIQAGKENDAMPRHCQRLMKFTILVAVVASASKVSAA